MTDEPEDAKPPATGAKSAEQAALETADVNDDIHRMLFDHEMERGGGSVKTGQPRRRRRLLKG